MMQDIRAKLVEKLANVPHVLFSSCLYPKASKRACPLSVGAELSRSIPLGTLSLYC